ncbi:MAG: acyl-CoA dehydrogenase family protein [Limisphaerales bacterium]
MNALPTPPTDPRPSPQGDDAAQVIDTSKMNAGQRAALEMTESARDAASEKGSFAANLFMGRYELGRLLPYPVQTPGDRDQGDAFLAGLEQFLRDNVDPDEIDRTGEIPDEVIEGLAKLGAFGIKISPQLGGLGLSQTNYCRAAVLLGSYCSNLAALVSAHQSIGVPQPLILFGTDEQKAKWLPRCAKGEISAFALTEVGVGSDPATLQTRAEPTPDGQHFVINGEKLWCTNLIKAGVLVVMAQTPAKVVNGKERKQVTAFIVDIDTPGVEIAHRCRFMGLRALYNGVVRFHDVKVPRANIILGEGKGLKVALSTLNTGRLTLPAACTGLAKRCLAIARKWSAERVQWGAPIGRHAAIADKLGRMAANIFAMEAMTLYTASLVDKDKKADIRLEAAMCKLWGSERAWEIVDDTMQIRGGRGYETAQSLKERGEEPVAVERLLRDCRINTIFEGSSEIMRLFIAREALDPHLKVAGAVLNSQLPLGVRAGAAMKAGLFYAGWYPLQWLPSLAPVDANPAFAGHLKFARRSARKLARSLFHAMALNGPKLEKQQVLLGRFVDIGTEIFALTATCARAEAKLKHAKSREEKESLLQLVECFCQQARLRIARHFDGLHHNADRAGYKLAQGVLSGQLGWLEDGIVSHAK